MTARKKKRHPPKGFSTWKAYMASIRPGAKRAARRNPGGSKMARKRKSTHRRRGAARRNVARRATSAAVHHHHKRRRYTARRNPPAGRMLRNIVPFAIDAGVGAVRTTAGKVAVRKLRALAKFDAGSPIGTAIEGVLAIVGGALLSTFHRGAGRDFAVGGLQAPLETTVQRLKIPFVSDSLGDDGFYLGEEYGVGGAPEYVQGGMYSPGALGRGLGEDPTYGLGASSSGERYSTG